MARISKRGQTPVNAEGGQPAVSSNVKRYKAGIYARLSSDQGHKAGRQDPKNESVEVQVEIAKKFVEEFNLKKTGEIIDVAGCYTDLGKTGSNFERDGFMRLLQDIRLGEINCVIVKDLSRFGRNYLEAGNYIEKIFPFLGVRFIAVADGFDTGKAGNENKQMDSEIKNLVNDMYAKDFSKKAKIHLKQRREEGSYVGGPPPYGYVTRWNDKKRILVPDDNTSMIVRFIYEKFVETESYTAVADLLNIRKINPPSVYKHTGNVYHSPQDVYHSPVVCHPYEDEEYRGWDKSAVERILKSVTYSGTLAQGKTSITARDEKMRIRKPEDEWVVTENAHEPLIDGELYQKAACVREKIAHRSASHKHPAKGCPIGENIFDGVLYCGVCGRKMTRGSLVKQHVDGEKVRIDGYFCLNSGQTKAAACPETNRISKVRLVDVLLPLIRMEFAVFLDKPKKYVEYGKERTSEAVKKAEADLRETEGKIRRFREEESNIYMEYRSGIIPQKDYVAYKLKQEGCLTDLRKIEENQRKGIKNLEKLSGRYLLAIKALFKLNSGMELTKEIIEALISRIHIYPGKRIEVLFTFSVDDTEAANGSSACPKDK